jgi:ribonucleotide reductase beta subunit family protein with ferritin-like domain
MSDVQRKADAAAAIDATKQKLWTPDQKVPESVRKMAFLFFLEHLKASFSNRQVADEWITDKDVYRRCIAMAKSVHEVDAENDPKT